MKRLKYLFISVMLGVPLLAGWVAVAHAQTFKTGDNVTVAADQTVDSTLYTAGKTLDIAGTVNGDVFCAGQNVTISGVVDGDVICAAQTLSVTGKVSGDVRLAGQNVSLSGTVGGNANVAGQTVTVDSSAKLARDFGVAGQDITLNGPVGRDLSVGAENVIINGPVGRDVSARVQSMTLQDKAAVAGDITYTSDNDLTKSQGATVSGTVTRSAPTHHKSSGGGNFYALGAGFVVFMWAAFLVFSLVLVLLFPRAIHVATETARGSLGKTFLVGFIASIVVPFVLFALMITVVGIPLALFAGLVWTVIVALSWPFAGYLTGRLVLSSTKVDNAIWTMIAGVLLLLVLMLIPVVGMLVWLVALWFGLGTLLLRLWVHYQKPHYHMAAETTAVQSEKKSAARRK